ncbi:ribonuclease P protein component [Leucobacter sp. OLJS4]|uniref:ribonuclease P protein component n=1 Tax=unclassified Leucobacter TaxID=2621730 RepID=UPI000C1A3120|nr:MULTISPECIES: ribonuclease P protein component [unclassified Leucobacter]PIJ54185.1 ribonuclease P protein component [Leucobacter sp. OLES1]PII87337.1 ribonuclease P protein component [Leucobacter sp. OLTLW20]PII94607.1 ribonuclease P protein component [Leucobacter sp. OLAS13]PIJ00595.1 ribonuclease P protein component [Leucobacter sp. OLDS2]PIJ03142.1 ribonuclease P protein component [Leucobacter sp. OLCS4]
MPARQHRVTRGDDYRRIVRTGNRVGGATCIAHAVLHVREADAPDQPARFGFIVSKAVGNAVTRNLVRRRLKFLVERGLHAGFEGADIVFRALPASAEAGFEGLERDVTRALGKVERMLAERDAPQDPSPEPGRRS